jgi:hypothetical protein
MLIRNRLQRLEGQLKVNAQSAAARQLRDAFRAIMQDREASEIMDEIAEASAEWGQRDGRTRAIIQRHVPRLQEALERHGVAHPPMPS